MDRPIIVVLILVLILVGVLAPGMFRGGQRNGELVFAPESVDIGTVPLNVAAPARFEMKNVGGSPVNIEGKVNVKAVEGC